MIGKPLFDVLSKLPSKSLLHFRCVSKLWREYIDDNYFVSVHDKQVIEDLTAIIFYVARNLELAKTLCFHTIESDTTTNHVLKAKNKVGVLEFVGKKLLNETSRIVGSCNGLVLIDTYDGILMPTYIVIHPRNKQCYVLPLPQLPLPCIQESCGFGFDSSTNTFKMVCVYLNTNYPYDHCTMVHVFGTNSWHEIPQVPSYRIYGKAIFAHGCLHWLASYNDEDGAKQVIWFDVKNEEFGLIKAPKTISKLSKRIFNHCVGDHLVNLDGQVGYFGNKTTEVWVLDDKKEWVCYTVILKTMIFLMGTTT
ncbi:F-box domain containing protein [Tanacetum coccineum]